MGTFTKGQIVLFPFPYTDLSDRKLRPCLVISEMMGEDILLCQITSQYINPDKYSISLRATETQHGSLHRDSFIRCNMIFTAHVSMIYSLLCTVPIAKYKQVVDTIHGIIYIPS